ncbi:hypothetical protein [Chlamydiifrater volucris]|nr:hypothetical protein [Chlamydiifrater volucris]
MKHLGISDFSVQSSILVLLGAKSATSRDVPCLTEDFVKCSNNRRVIEILENPLSAYACQDLIGLLNRVGSKVTPSFKPHAIGDTQAVYLQGFYHLSLFAICADLCLPQDEFRSSVLGRCLSCILVATLLFGSIICGVRHLILFAKSRERSKALLEFISAHTQSATNLSNQQVAMVSAAKKTLNAEKAYSRIKVLFGVLETVFFVGVLLSLVQPILSALSMACLSGVVSCITVVGLSIVGVAALLYLPLLILESYAKRKVSGDLEKALCFYLLAKHTPKSLASLKVPVHLLSFTEEDSFVKDLLKVNQEAICEDKGIG